MGTAFTQIYIIPFRYPHEGLFACAFKLRLDARYHRLRVPDTTSSDEKVPIDARLAISG